MVNCSDQTLLQRQILKLQSVTSLLDSMAGKEIFPQSFYMCKLQRKMVTSLMLYKFTFKK